ncbi:hypothetical protein FQR65_LT18691 [Abscondita terminalis]|nr:hypothetical protein FQR65_LT18691 [Abscondita terminalis]
MVMRRERDPARAVAGSKAGDGAMARAASAAADAARPSCAPPGVNSSPAGRATASGPSANAQPPSARLAAGWLQAQVQSHGNSNPPGAWSFIHFHAICRMLMRAASCWSFPILGVIPLTMMLPSCVCGAQCPGPHRAPRRPMRCCALALPVRGWARPRAGHPGDRGPRSRWPICSTEGAVYAGCAQGARGAYVGQFNSTRRADLFDLPTGARRDRARRCRAGCPGWLALSSVGADWRTGRMDPHNRMLIRNAGIRCPRTFLRAAYFMENWRPGERAVALALLP